MKISKELAKGSTGLLVLSVISKTDMYGYQIIKTLEVMSENVFSLNESGLAELADKKREWQSFSGAVSKVLGGAKLAAEV